MPDLVERPVRRVRAGRTMATGSIWASRRRNDKEGVVKGTLGTSRCAFPLVLPCLDLSFLALLRAFGTDPLSIGTGGLQSMYVYRFHPWSSLPPIFPR